MNSIDSGVRLQALLLLLLSIIFLSTPFAYAADIPPESTATQETKTKLDKLLKSITTKANSVTQLEGSIAGREGLSRKIMAIRLAQARDALLESNLDFIGAVLEQQKDGQPLPSYQEKAKIMLASHRALAKNIQTSIVAQITMPAEDLSAAAEAAAYERIFHHTANLDHLYLLLINSINFARQLGLDASADEAQLKNDLSSRAANVSVLLELARNDVRGFQAGVAVLPDDTELMARLNLAKGRIHKLAAALNETVILMNQLEMETTSYHELSIAATGQITAEALEGGVMKMLILGWGKEMSRLLIEEGPDLFLKLLIFILIIVAARKFSRVGKKMTEMAIRRSDAKLSLLLRRMLISISGNIILILGILIALSQIGISLGPLLAGLGVVGFVVGFALQDVLSNFASGMMILIYRPFDVGDLVDTGGVFGKVNQMSLVNTTILTLDNQTIVIPNNKIWGDVIKNVTSQVHRRVDLLFGVAYTDNIPTVEKILQEVVDADKRILDEPEAIVRLHELGDSSVNFVVRSWVKTEDYWDVYWALLRTVKMRFDEEGISIPFPQRDMHLDTSEPLSIRIEQNP